VTVRLARVDDLPLLRELVQRAYQRYVERIGRRPAPMDDDYAAKVRERQVFIAEDEGVAGLIVLVAGSDHLLVENVAVDPNRQGAGVGRALMAHAETYAHERGLRELRLYTNAAMTENLAFYPHLGYAEVARRTDDGFQRVFFAKAMAPPNACSRNKPGNKLSKTEALSEHEKPINPGMRT
jgi:GNAT superfamily N-acetyltransferase